jgi:hypothetical protein
MKKIFYQKLQEDWSDKRAEITNEISRLIAEGRKGAFKQDFVVEISEYKEQKSLPQLRAIHKLCDLLIPHLEDKHGIKYNRAKVKAFIKLELGYMRDPEPFEIAYILRSCGIEKSHPNRLKAIKFARSIKQPESFAAATKEKMIELIESIQAFAAQEGYDNVKLEPKDLLATLEYYRNLNGEKGAPIDNILKSRIRDQF